MKVMAGGVWRDWADFGEFFGGPLTDCRGMFQVRTTGLPPAPYGPWVGLTRAPELDTSQVTDMRFMFSGCSSLVSVPELDTSQVTDMRSMFSGCSSLVSAPPIDASSATSLTDIVRGCPALERLPITGVSVDISVAGTSMGATALNQLFQGLNPVTATRTVTITGTPGAADCDRSIATAKGWTVTG